MRLCTPQIRGPVNEWMTDLKIEGCVSGATILVRTIGSTPRDIAKVLAAGSGRDRIPVLTGVALFAGERLVVMQTLNGVDSPWTADILALVVASVPTDQARLAPVSFISRPFECGTRIWIGGTVPGARVTIKVGSTTIGDGAAKENGARLPLLTRLTSAGNLVEATQEAPAGRTPLLGMPKIVSKQIIPLPVLKGELLPPPRLNGDLPRGCEVSIPISGVIDGAEVMIARSSDRSSEIVAFDREALTFILNKPLDKSGDKLQITQTMRQCERAGLPLDVKVLPAEQPRKLTVLPPCPGTSIVQVIELLRGARVTLDINGTMYQGQTPPDSTSFGFGVDPIPPNAMITVVQEYCGLLSAPVAVNARALLVTGAAELADPLFECARCVRVAKAVPGALVQIWAEDQDGKGAISDLILAREDSLRVNVTPYLQSGQKVWVSQLACGGPWLESDPHLVTPSPKLEPPKISVPPIVGDEFVVVDAIPGAMVEVLGLEGELLGEGLVDPAAKGVLLKRQLNEKEEIRARQSLCAQTSELGPIERVLPGQKQFVLKASIEQLSRTADMEPVVCERAVMVCNHDGTWQLNAYFENRTTEADCSLIFSFELLPNGVPPFGKVEDIDLSAAGNGRVTKIGLRIRGVPSTMSLMTTGSFPGFRNSVYWSGIVLPADGNFKMIVAWQTYPESEPDDAEEEKP
jgi:hypothetical protein